MFTFPTNGRLEKIFSEGDPYELTLYAEEAVASSTQETLRGRMEVIPKLAFDTRFQRILNAPSLDWELQLNDLSREDAEELYKNFQKNEEENLFQLPTDQHTAYDFLQRLALANTSEFPKISRLVMSWKGT